MTSRDARPRQSRRPLSQQPTRRLSVGSLVRYKGGETFQTQQAEPTAGIYTIHNTDDYVMCGFIEIKDALGRISVVAPDLLEPVIDDSDGSAPSHPLGSEHA